MNWAEVADSFSRGVLNASSQWRKVYRWAVLVGLWLAAVVCVAMLVAAPFVVSGWGLASAIFMLVCSLVVFSVGSVAFMHVFATTEILGRRS